MKLGTLVFYLIYPLLWLISKLPFPLLYPLSNGIYVLLYHVIQYRRRTVRENMALALPHLTEKERKRLEKNFYHHLCDIFLEMVKTISISEKELEKRFVFTNLEDLFAVEKQGKSIAVLCSHYGSYEWIISINRLLNHKGYAIYKRIRNRRFDRLARKIRARFGATLITTKETAAVIARNRVNHILSVYGFAADQSPKPAKANHWTTFMGMEVPVYTGAETLAKRFDMNMVFLQVEKVKRGHYAATFVPLTDNPKDIPDFQLTDRFLQLTEAQIKEAPEYYLWTHRRWKHRVR